MSKLHQFRKAANNNTREECPAPAIWGELAAGLMTRETSFAHLEHAASCAACAEELQHAMFAVDDSSPIPEEIRKQMATVTEEWRRRFAEQLAAQKIPASGRLRKALSRTWKKVTKTKKPKPGNEEE